MRRAFLIAAVVAACLTSPGVAFAQSATRGLHADALRTTLTLLPDGSLQVTEAITFRFTGRAFSEVERQIPARFTDGIIDVEARLDGRVLPEGRGDGEVRIARRRREVRVLWRFPKTTDATHEFTLSYRAMGVARQATGRATFAWHVLPSRHRYAISEAEVRWVVPAGVTSLAGPAMEAQGWTWQPGEPGTWVARKSGIAVNETAILTDAFAQEGLSMSTPAWQVREERARQMAPAFIVGAIVVLVMGAGIIAMTFVRYHRPRVDRTTAMPADPGSLPPALGIALRSTHPRAGLAQMSATVFDLLARGVLEIEETSAKGAPERSRTFDVVARGDARHAGHLRPHEQVVLDALWLHMKQGRVPLTKAQQHLVGAHRAFSRAVHEELRVAGLLDAERVWASRSLTVAGLVAIGLALVGLVVFVSLLAGFGEAALLVPGAVFVVGLGLMIVGQGFPTVSGEGAALSARWAARARALRAATTADLDLNVWLPYAVGLGLGRRFAKSGAAVTWLQGLPNPSGALIAVIAAGGSSHGSGGVGVSGGGMAGGGGFSGAR